MTLFSIQTQAHLVKKARQHITKKEFSVLVKWAILFLPNLLLQIFKLPIGKRNAFKAERRDILGRANWLADKVLVQPTTLLESMPNALGKHFGGEWAIYTLSHYSAALLNISRLYPEEKGVCIERIKRIVEIASQRELREYDTSKWGEDALETLSGKNSHMTYLSILAWIITNYKMAGGNNDYDDLLHNCCEALHRRMMASPDMNLLSFPGTPVFLPDMLFCIVALHQYSILFNGRYANTVQAWLDKARTEWIDPQSGLLVSTLPCQRKVRSNLRGSYTALNCYCLCLVNQEFAREQYEKMKASFLQTKPIYGISEFKSYKTKLGFDVDAGPIAFGCSASGTVWAIGSATCFQDRKVRRRLMHTGEIAGITIGGKKKRHYLLGEYVLVGEAVALAMRTNIHFKTGK